MNIKTLSADEILSINPSHPEQLFNKDTIDFQLKLLQSKWHPDRNLHPRSGEVFKHIMLLYNNANNYIINNTWSGPSVLDIITTDRKHYRLSYKKMHQFELGYVYISSTKICYVINPKFEILFNNAVKILESKIQYPSTELECEFKQFMPNIQHIFLNTNIGHILVLEKTSDIVMLQDLLDYMPDNNLDPKHVAWIMSSLLNISCFLEYTNLVHLGLSTNTVFVNPKQHTCYIFGGWWYTTINDNKILAIPKTSSKVLPKTELTNKLAKLKYNRMLIKAIGLRCLGDNTLTGTSLLKDPNIPSHMLKWMRDFPVKTASQEYSNWYSVLTKCYGKRTFIELNVNIEDI